MYLGTTGLSMTAECLQTPSSSMAAQNDLTAEISVQLPVTAHTMHQLDIYQAAAPTVGSLVLGVAPALALSTARSGRSDGFSGLGKERIRPNQGEIRSADARRAVLITPWPNTVFGERENERR